MKQFTIITGMSGSGKTKVIRYLEDMGFFCVDNMPPMLIPTFGELLESSGKFENVAIVVDVRVGEMLDELVEQVNSIRGKDIDVKLLFLNTSDEVLVHRYKETRRSHPIEDKGGLLASIQKERQLLSGLLNEADYTIDTSNLTNAGLLRTLKDMYGSAEEKTGMQINVLAFGFKYGLPMDCDLVYDVRCFPNPFYIEDLKHKTGNDKEVQDYVMSFPSAVEFMEKLNDMMKFLIPLYIEEGKLSLTIGIGCTGGKHRSVTMAHKLSDTLKELGYKVNTVCRDVDKK